MAENEKSEEELVSEIKQMQADKDAFARQIADAIVPHSPETRVEAARLTVDNVRDYIFDLALQPGSWDPIYLHEIRDRVLCQLIGHIGEMERDEPAFCDELQDAVHPPDD